MNAQSRRQIEIGTRALMQSRAHPDTDAGYAVSEARLQQRFAEDAQLLASWIGASTVLGRPRRGSNEEGPAGDEARPAA